MGQGLPHQEGQAASCRQLMHTVLATSREWLWALDDEGRFRFSSEASKNLLGYRPAELMGEHFSIVVDEDHLPESIADLISSPGTPGSAEGLVRCRHRDGKTVWIDSSVLNRPARRGRIPGLEGTSRRYRSATLDRRPCQSGTRRSVRPSRARGCGRRFNRSTIFPGSPRWRRSPCKVRRCRRDQSGALVRRSRSVGTLSRP